MGRAPCLGPQSGVPSVGTLSGPLVMQARQGGEAGGRALGLAEALMVMAGAGFSLPSTNPGA